MSNHSAETIATILSFHNPLARNEPMVYEVWEDGEITITKGADLYGRRTLHTIALGGHTPLPVETLPLPNVDGTHSRIMVTSFEEAETVRNLIMYAP
jgi:hypothetical protein